MTKNKILNKPIKIVEDIIKNMTGNDDYKYISDLAYIKWYMLWLQEAIDIEDKNNKIDTI